MGAELVVWIHKLNDQLYLALSSRIKVNMIVILNSIEDLIYCKVLIHDKATIMKITRNL